MAVATRWTVTHSCGHEAEHDLTARPADRRASYARWLCARDCTDCWRAERDANRGAERTAWLATRRAEEQEASAAWSAQYRMPPLSGPQAILDWGERTRHQLMTAAYKVLVVEGELTDEQWQQAEDRARTVDRAGWWIDQREAEAADLPELLDAATDADRITENPF
ncbi:hypothetical protein KNE206_53480 [Kitasatospora sp. NE20-6]|uniref:hypothetical protein n=1 Tax=Kitasatospora sp. NE20-6 TaxID=2859066 RepID=UPI0034DC0C45